MSCSYTRGVRGLETLSPRLPTHRRRTRIRDTRLALRGTRGAGRILPLRFLLPGPRQCRRRLNTECAN